MNKNSLIIKVSKLYYQNRLSKIEISEKLKISRFKVANLLEDAVKNGVVKITINEPQNTFLDLEDALEKKFKIHRAVITASSYNYEETKINIGKAAADCLLDMVCDDDVIGIAWGTTISAMVNSLSPSIDKKNISVVQITGGLNQVATEYNAIELSGKVAKLFNAKSYMLYAPAIVDNEETKKILFSESDIKKTLDMFDKINIAVVGIGIVSPKPSTALYRDGFIKDEDLEDILKNDAIGDINSYFYDKNGNKCSTKLENRTIGMNLDQLKRARYVIAVAGGDFKLQAIYSALKGKIINIIITDNETAERILEMD